MMAEEHSIVIVHFKAYMKENQSVPLDLKEIGKQSLTKPYQDLLNTS
jgi:hypothetical protein